jgi:hypothetical protein
MQLSHSHAAGVADRPRHIGRLVYQTIVAIAAACWLASTAYVLFPRWPEPRNAAEAPLVADPAALDFGVVWNSQNFQWTVPIRNTTDKAIQVTRVEGSCSCTAVKPTAFLLNPGERIGLKLAYNLASRAHEWVSGRPEPFEGTVVAHTGQDDRPIARWEIHGHVKNAFFTKPDELRFDESLVYGQPYQQLLASIDEQYGAVIVRSAGVDGRHFQVHVAPKATLDIGVHEFKVFLTAVLKSGERLPDVPVSVEAHVLHDLQILPSLAHFGDLKVGEAREETISLASRSGRNFDVASYTSASKDVSVVPLSRDQPESKAFRVKLRSSRTGPQESEVRFNIHYKGPSPRTAGDVTDRAVFSVRYYGMP